MRQLGENLVSLCLNTEIDNGIVLRALIAANMSNLEYLCADKTSLLQSETLSPQFLQTVPHLHTFCCATNGRPTPLRAVDALLAMPCLTSLFISGSTPNMPDAQLGALIDGVATFSYLFDDFIDGRVPGAAQKTRPRSCRVRQCANFYCMVEWTANSYGQDSVDFSNDDSGNCMRFKFCAELWNRGLTTRQLYRWDT